MGYDAMLTSYGNRLREVASGSQSGVDSACNLLTEVCGSNPIFAAGGVRKGIRCQCFS